MHVTHETRDNTLYIKVSGNLIFEATTDFGLELDKLMELDYQEAVLDFSDVSGITSSAIGKVIDFHQKLEQSGRKMRIKGMSDKAYSVFQYFKLNMLRSVQC